MFFKKGVIKIKKNLYLWLIIVFINSFLPINTSSDSYYIEFHQELKAESSILEDNNRNETFFGVLEIPKINLKKEFGSSVNNNVDQNIELISRDLNNLVLAAHSGNTSVSYFNQLDKLAIGDRINIYVDKEFKTYQVVKIKETIKNGQIEVSKGVNEKMLTLTTCSPHKEGYQLIISALL